MTEGLQLLQGEFGLMEVKLELSLVVSSAAFRNHKGKNGEIILFSIAIK